MKKTYKQPLTEVVKINAEQMICDSQLNTYSGNPQRTLSKDDYDSDSSDDLW